MEDGLKEKLKTEKNPLLKAALEYLLIYKWSIIPLNGKRPYREWAEFQTRLPTEQELRDWWHQWPKANIGIVCGRISGLVVLDIDGKEGEKSLAKKRNAPITIAAKTGKGSHFYYLHPGREVKNFARKEPGLDFRGDGGYVVAPPSIHPETQNEYEWTLYPQQEELADCPDWLMDMLGEKRSAYSSKKGEDSLVKVLNGLPEGERDQGIFRYACRLRGKGISKIETEVLICNSAANCTPPFPRDQALKKIEQAWKYDGPEVSSPEDINPENVFEKSSLMFLAKLKKTDAGAYAKVKQRLKGSGKEKINMNDLEKAVKEYRIKESGMQLVEKETTTQNNLSNILPNFPFQEMLVPNEWTIDRSGVWQIEYKNDLPKRIYATAAPTILTRRLKNIDTEEEKIELAYFMDGQWKHIISERATVFNSRSLVMLANRGLLVSSENARLMVRYFDDLQRTNRDILPTNKSVSRTGWIGESNFLPGAAGDIVLDTESIGAFSVAAAIKPKGTLEKWKDFALKIRKFPLARFMLAAAFAAPLIKLVNERVFLVHVWESTTGGKTAAALFALSVWGNPELLSISFNTTKVGLERTAALFNDLPIGIDEKQAAKDKQAFIENLVYLLGLGKGKARGSKTGGLQTFQYWRTIAITTGEEPLSTASSTGGIKTRALEICAKAIPEEMLAKRVYSEIKENYGQAGPTFIQSLIAFIQKDPKRIQQDFEYFKQRFRQKNPKNIETHIAAVATIALGDYYVSQWLFDTPEDVAKREIEDICNEAISLLENAEEIDDGKRAMDYFMSWYNVNDSSFTNSAIKERYGMEYSGVLYVFPTIFERMMNEGGFHPSKILKNWADREWLVTEIKPSDGKRRLKVRRSFNGRKSVVFVGINLAFLNMQTQGLEEFEDADYENQEKK